MVPKITPCWFISSAFFSNNNRQPSHISSVTSSSSSSSRCESVVLILCTSTSGFVYSYISLVRRSYWCTRRSYSFNQSAIQHTHDRGTRRAPRPHFTSTSPIDNLQSYMVVTPWDEILPNSPLVQQHFQIPWITRKDLCNTLEDATVQITDETTCLSGRRCLYYRGT